MEEKHSMTSGSIWKSLVAFSIPLILGNLFQQLYNVIDSVIVGNFVGKEALAAVGAGGSILVLMVGFYIGAAIGAGIVTSQAYGAKDMERLHDALHTSVAIAIIGGLVLTAAGIVFTPLMLRAISTPDDVFDQAVVYLRVFMSGSIFATIYNMCAGILNAVGNSRRSLIYLIISSVTNAILDVLFVGVFRWGIVGAAAASAVSMFVSCVFILRYLITTTNSYKLNIREIKLYKGLPSQILKLGIPSGFQNVVISLSNVIVQAAVNSFGSDIMAGATAYTKVEGFMLLPIMSLGMAATTYTGQNYGAREDERIVKGARVSTAIGVGYAIVVAIIVYFTAPYIISIFTDDAEVIESGVFMLNCMLPTYWLLAIFNVKSGTIRGVGKTFQSMVISVASLCVLRIIWITFVFADSHSLFLLMINYPVTWLAGAVLAAVYEKKYLSKKHQLTEN
ncbi:MAG: MATE family efflux transporter [Emergencia sp.]